MERLRKWIGPRLRLWAIYKELGYNPWHRPRKAGKQGKGVYMGAREAIPFMNEDGKRTFAHLFLRPGYMMRDYIRRSAHEHYLAPFTALLVFYSVFTLVVAVVKPDAPRSRFGKEIINGAESAEVNLDSPEAEKTVRILIQAVTDVILITRLDLYPEAADTPWKASLGAIEGDLRSKGIPLFLGNFLILWLAMGLLLRKYGISVSGAAAASAYVLCQFCIFMFLALLLTIGRDSELGVGVMGILLLIDYRQLLCVSFKEALKLTLKTGLVYVAILGLFYLLLAAGFVIYAFTQV